MVRRNVPSRELEHLCTACYFLLELFEDRVFERIAHAVWEIEYRKCSLLKLILGQSTLLMCIIIYKFHTVILRKITNFS